MTDKINHIKILLDGWKRTRAATGSDDIANYATGYIDALEAALVILGAMTEQDTESAKRINP
jgi:hypothetical protein